MYQTRENRPKTTKIRTLRTWCRLGSICVFFMHQYKIKCSNLKTQILVVYNCLWYLEHWCFEKKEDFFVHSVRAIAGKQKVLASNHCSTF